MTELRLRLGFSMGHTLPNHSGKCRRLHGHNYEGHVMVSGPIDQRTGMIMDFGDLKRLIREATDLWDHYFMVWDEDPRLETLQSLGDGSLVVVPFPPTVESMVSRLRSIIARKIESYATLEGYPEGTFSVGMLLLNETADCGAFDA